MDQERFISVEVAFARPEIQRVVALSVRKGTTVEQAIIESGMLERFPEISLSTNRVGIFGCLVSPRTVLSEGDRVEIYRPLALDPREQRRRRAERQGRR